MLEAQHIISTFTLTDYLDHDWSDELVGYPIAYDGAVGVIDEASAAIPCQQAEGKVWFRVDRLPALGQRSFRAVAAEAGTAAVSATREGEAFVLSNGLLALKIPAGGVVLDGQALPGPVLAVRLGEGAWLGSSELTVRDAVAVDEIAVAEIEAGALWSRWQITYRGAGTTLYVVSLRIFAGKTFVEVTEDAYFNHTAAWDFDLLPGLNPDLGFTHAHQNIMELPARTHPLGGERHNLGAITLPNYGGIYVADDYVFFTLCRAGGERVSACGIHGGAWLYPADNQIEINTSDTMAAFNFPCKAGHREWCLAVEAHAEDDWQARWYDTLAQRVVHQYDTSLQQVKEMVLEWSDDGAARPSLMVTPAQLPALRAKCARIPALRDYVEMLNPDGEGEWFRYHSGSWSMQDLDSPNDPPTAYLVTGDRRAAEKTKEMILAGVRHRLHTFLSPTGNLNGSGTSYINVGRGLRPWIQFYDLIAEEGVFSADEERWFRAACAFLAYKMADRDYFPVEALLYHSDHPRSEHRTHWYPNRESDYNYHNIDNLPHNFHQELYVTQIAVALAFPGHPTSRAWLYGGMELLDKELTEFVFPCGAWIESATYTFGAMGHLLIPTMHLLRQAGVRDFFADPRFKKIFRFLAKLITGDDARCGHGAFPVLGDASFPGGYASVFNWMATLCAAEDPDFAGEMQYAWERYGRQISPRRCQGLNYLDVLFIGDKVQPQAPQAFQSENLPGMGAILRRRQSEPDESYFIMKCGRIYSHFHGDEGAFFLYAKGAPLMDDYGVQYFTGSGEQRRHNVVEFDGRECYNRGTITTFRSAPYGDFFIAEMPIHVLYIPPGLGQWGFKGEEGPFGWWRRYVMYVKELDYFVIYDEIESPYQTKYHLHCLADTYQQNGNLVHFAGRFGVDLDVLLLADGQAPVEMVEFCPAERNSGQPEGEEWFRQWSINLTAGPDQHYACVLAPHLPGETLDIQQVAGQTTARIAGADDEVLTFLSAAPITQQVGDCRYEGRAGIIRKTGGVVELIQLFGRLIAVGDVVIEGDGPFKATVTGDLIEIDCQQRTHLLKVQTGGRHLLAPGAIEPLADGRVLVRMW